MKKIITLGLISSLSALLFVGCGGTPSPEDHSGMVERAHMTQEKVHKIIVKAAQADGWSMTEFKSNALIAEKEGEEAVTVTFDKSSFDLSPANSSLNSTLSSALE
jgi:hypothetical protein